MRDQVNSAHAWDTAAVAPETRKIYQNDCIGGQVKPASPKFQQHPKALAGHPLVGEARGIGLIGTVSGGMGVWR
jgi:4-aminobutyrate--pyruvate transaminase